MAQDGPPLVFNVVDVIEDTPVMNALSHFSKHSTWRKNQPFNTIQYNTIILITFICPFVSRLLAESGHTHHASETSFIHQKYWLGDVNILYVM